MFTYDLYCDLKEALSNREGDPYFFDLSGSDHWDAMGCEVSGFLNDTTTFWVVVSFNDQTVSLSWGWKDVTFRLDTVWVADAPDLPQCNRCGCNHEAKDSCFGEWAKVVVVPADQLIEAVMAEIDRVLVFSDPYLPQPVAFADVKLAMDGLIPRWNEAARLLIDSRSYGFYEPFECWTLEVESTQQEYKLMWLEQRGGKKTEMLGFYAYRDEHGWRIDFHFVEFGKRTAYEPIRLQGESESPEAPRCKCCVDAPVVTPEVMWLYRVTERLWKDVRIRVDEARRDVW